MWYVLILNISKITSIPTVPVTCDILVGSSSRGPIVYAINAESVTSPVEDASSTPTLFESSGLFAAYGCLL